MQVTLGGAKVRGGDLFSLIWRGYFVGATLIILPLTIIILIGNLFAMGSEFQWPMIFAPVMGVGIAALQGVIVGGLVLLGLRIYPPKAPDVPGANGNESASRG